MNTEIAENCVNPYEESEHLLCFRKKKVILIVDDDRFNILSAELTIKRNYSNIECITALNGLEAIK